MEAIRFSLVTATFGRTADLERLLQSLAEQDYWSFELIIVDQNPDCRLEPILAKWRTRLSEASAEQFPAERRVVHLKALPGASKARNLGLQAASHGEITAFPDDDCWYPPQLLANVDRWFQENRSYDILTVAARSEDGQRSGNKWMIPNCDLTKTNIFRTSVMYATFVRNSKRGPAMSFDETMGPGPGMKFGASEDTDLLLSLLEQGAKGRFNSTWFVGHPRRDMLSGSVSRSRVYSYGMGMGRALAKHRMPLLFVVFVVYDFLRAGVMTLIGKTEPAFLWFNHGKGIFSGYFASPATTVDPSPKTSVNG